MVVYNCSGCCVSLFILKMIPPPSHGVSGMDMLYRSLVLSDYIVGMLTLDLVPTPPPPVVLVVGMFKCVF